MKPLSKKVSLRNDTNTSAYSLLKRRLLGDAVGIESCVQGASQAAYTIILTAMRPTPALQQQHMCLSPSDEEGGGTSSSRGTAPAVLSPRRICRNTHRADKSASRES